MERISIPISLLCCSVVAQMPVIPPLPPATNHFGAAAVLSNEIAWSNDVATTNRNVDLEWLPSPTTGVTYVIGKGTKSGVYTFTNQVGTNTHSHFPAIYPPVLLTVRCGGTPFTTSTDRFHMFMSRATSRSNLWDISDSTNLAKGWSDAFAFVTASNGQFTVSP